MKETMAYDLGLDCAVNGANTVNCYFKIFRTPNLKDAWQRGYDKGKVKDK